MNRAISFALSRDFLSSSASGKSIIMDNFSNCMDKVYGCIQLFTIMRFYQPIWNISFTSYTSDVDLKRLGRTQIPDDPQLDPPIPFIEGTVSFAGGGENSRTSQLFISYSKSNGLGHAKWETPIGMVTSGMENIRNLYSDYGDMPPWGKGPEQGPIHARGSAYIEEEYPLLDKFIHCSVERNPENDSPKEQNVVTKEEKVVTGGVAVDTREERNLRAPKDNTQTHTQTSIFLSFAFILIVFLVILFAIKRPKKKDEKNK
mmetsp:Transcript_15000/g.21883  ORF Transcript_15000/g.21883 Transcript_15000/m.21883 type:complete len:259 (+) Transcript_15000:199-975(+)